MNTGREEKGREREKDGNGGIKEKEKIVKMWNKEKKQKEERRGKYRKLWMKKIKEREKEGKIVEKRGKKTVE